MKIVSERWSLNKEDVNKAAHNALVFLAPALLIFLVQIQSGKTFKEAADVFTFWLLSVVVDFLRKWSTEKTYIKQ